MALLFLDTNILLRHLRQDDPVLSPKATAVLSRIEQGELEVSTDPKDLGVELRDSALHDWVLDVATRAAYQTPLFRGWVYLCLAALGMLAVLRSRRGQRLQGLVLGSSGLAYGVSYLFVSVGCEFRFNCWLVVSTMVSGLLLLASGRRPGSDAGSANPWG